MTNWSSRSSDISLTPTPKTDLDHADQPMKEACDYYGDMMGGNLFNKGSVTKCFTVRIPTRAASAKSLR
jgi:hypothetical protein